MKPLTYLGFTIFSVFIQFCVMEFIHEKFQLDKDSTILNETAKKNIDIIEKINRKPHGLFYRIDIDKSVQNNKNAKSAQYSNSSLEDSTISTTDVTSTTFDVFYDENTSLAEDFFTTESNTSSELDNVTEITLINTSSTTAKPSLSKKDVSKEKCFCDILFKMCDINCCCDNDCMEEDRHLFINCAKDGTDKCNQENIHSCNNHASHRNTVSSGVFDDLFCIEKVNLPKKRVKSHFKYNEPLINASYKWRTIVKIEAQNVFEKKNYEYGDPLWLIRNNSIFSTFLPTTVANDYCNGRKQMKFLINENIRCNVKMDDLYVFPMLEALEGTKVISVIESALNNTVLNCSTLHCTNWTVLVCDHVACGEFNSTTHAPNCSENYCKNIILKFQYIFYYFESRITNASIILYMSNVRANVQLVMQEIDVEWYLGSESIDRVIQLSGNPGYISGLPIIVSFVTNNHTENFYNRTSRLKNKLSLPYNENGKCTWSNSGNKTVLFGVNQRSKCRLNLQQSNFSNNATGACQNIQNNIKEYLSINQKLFVSPYGNPQSVNDDKWIPLEVYDQTFLYGAYQKDNSKLCCYNMVSRFAFFIAYADMSGKLQREENEIVKANVDGTALNVTFDTVDLSIVLTVDIRFIDISRPIVEFAGAPSLNLHLPANFFLDYQSNKCYITGGDIVSVFLFSLVLLCSK